MYRSRRLRKGGSSSIIGGKERCYEMTQFLHCKKAELPGDKKRPPIRAIVSTAPTGGLLLSLPRDAECPTNAPTEVIFYDPILGVARCSCILSAPVPAGELRTYRCQVLEKLSHDQRREDLKISLSVPVEVAFRGKSWSSIVHNISASGVLLVSNLQAKKGDRLSFLFPKTDPPVPLTAEVLRVELRPPRNGRLSYGYGCRFVGLKAQHESLLRSYVFQEEKRLYRNG